MTSIDSSGLPKRFGPELGLQRPRLRHALHACCWPARDIRSCRAVLAGHVRCRSLLTKRTERDWATERMQQERHAGWKASLDHLVGANETCAQKSYHIEGGIRLLLGPLQVQ